MLRIAVDAMGGDDGPKVAVPGSLAGARKHGVGLLLVGQEATIRAILARHPHDDLDIEIRHAPEEITMDDHPVQSVRRKPESSIMVALDAVRQGGADAMVSAGNSGAVMAAALAVLGRVPGVERPAIAAVLPCYRDPTLVLDLGAVADAKPAHLRQFALMGNLYAHHVMRVAIPRIALLSNGEEPTKGNALAREVHTILAAEPGLRFVGNVEGKDLLAGNVDVIVTDGFTGNVALKVAEGTAAVMGAVMREEFTRTVPRKLAALLLKPALQSVKARLDYAEIGGAPLLGVNGAVIIAHGRSSELAIANAIGAAASTSRSDLPKLIAHALKANKRA